LLRSDSSLSSKSEGAKSASGAAGGIDKSSSGSGASAKGAVATLSADAAAELQLPSTTAQQRAPVGVLDLAVKAFDTRK
jgi:hypothetical protein